jgi:uncharacterized protein YdeI (YjbR/CyaY-like superfamily)
MEIGKTLNVTSREEWRRWLVGHHRNREEIWLVFWKKDSGKPSLSYNEAVEEAICFGWIDSQIRSIDEQRFARRFTPRRKGSGWSRYNRARALRMLQQGRMTEAGRILLPEDVARGWGETPRGDGSGLEP